MKTVFKHLTSNDVKGELLRGVGWAACIQFFGIVISFLLIITLARVLGPEVYGIYTLVISVVTVMALPFKSGLPNLLVREVAIYHKNNQLGFLKGLVLSSIVFSLLWSAVALTAFLLCWFFSGMISLDEAFLWGLILVPIWALENVRSSVLRGLRYVVSSQFPDMVVRPLLLFLIVFVALEIGVNFTAALAIQATILATFLALLASLFMVIRGGGATSTLLFSPEYRLRFWGKSLLPLSVFSGLKMLDTQVSFFLLGAFIDSQEVAVFRVATATSGLVAVGLTAVNFALAPQIARLYSEGKLLELQRLISISTRLVAAVSVPIVIVLGIWGEALVSLVFGGEYKSAFTPLIILGIGQLVNVLSGSVVLVMSMTGNDRYLMVSGGVALILNFLISLIMVPLFGAQGAAIGASISLISWNVLLVFAVKKRVGVNTFLSFS